MSLSIHLFYYYIGRLLSFAIISLLRRFDSHSSTKFKLPVKPAPGLEATVVVDQSPLQIIL